MILCYTNSSDINQYDRHKFISRQLHTMIQTLNTSQAANLLFHDTNAKWSYTGAVALVEYFEQIEVDTGQQMEFDCVAIRCDFTEYDSAEDAVKELAGEGIETDPLAWLRRRTTVIEVDGERVIVQQF